MNEYLEDKNLIEALEITNTLQTPPKGLTKFIPTSETDKVLIKQNNTIIILLLTLHKKLDLLQKRLDKQPETNLTEVTKNIDQISEQLLNLNLKNSGRETVTRKPIKLLNFPKIEIK